MRTKFICFLVGLCLARPISAHAQSEPPVPSTGPSMTFHFGQAVSALTGPWKFHVGDSPMGAKGPLWASRSFDDAGWETLDLKSAPGATDPTIGNPGYVPGWTAMGHSGYWGYAWYRIRVHVVAPSDQRLAIEGPYDVDDGYQLFANGTLLGSFGKFSNGKDPVIYNTQPSMFSLPDEGSKGDYLLAFRVWMAPGALVLASDAGGFHAAPFLGEFDSIEDQHRLAWLARTRDYAVAPLLASLFLLMAVIACGFFLFDRSDKVYPWLAGVFLLMALDRARVLVVSMTQWESITLDILQQDVAIALTLGGWLAIWWSWFGLRRPAWIPRMIAVLTVIYAVSYPVQHNLVLDLVPPSVNQIGRLVSLIARLLLLSLLVMIVVRGIREQGREGWLVLPAILLMAFAQFQLDLISLHIHAVWFPFGAQLSSGAIAYLALVGVIFVLLTRRLVLSSQRQRELALDVKQAQEVQHVLLPERISVPGLKIETEYRPSREVGGDFFQIIPHGTDGSVLIIVGDVTGKGLQAGMLVALLVGAIRSTAELSDDPQYMLHALNRRLLGRNSAHATCLALRIQANGAVTLANAGHLPPYINGIELSLEGALPLGMLAEAEFPVASFQLDPESTLTLISDGIVEAQDGNGHLFGFARLRELLCARVNPSALALAAQNFGQEDDISVVSVTTLKYGAKL